MSAAQTLETLLPRTRRISPRHDIAVFERLAANIKALATAALLRVDATGGCRDLAIRVGCWSVFRSLNIYIMCIYIYSTVYMS